MTKYNLADARRAWRQVSNYPEGDMTFGSEVMIQGVLGLIAKGKITTCEGIEVIDDLRGLQSDVKELFTNDFAKAWQTSPQDTLTQVTDLVKGALTEAGVPSGLFA